MNSFKKIGACSILTLLAFQAGAADSKSAAAAKPVEKSSESLLTSFHCEKFSGGLGDLKLKMVETCNLEKPFSSSMARTVGGEEIYVVCCHNSK